MRNSLYVILFCLLAITACNEDFSIDADYQEIPIIIGLLDIEDSVHYVSITKAFLDETQDALVMAQVADSLYFPDQLLVEIEEYNNGSMLESVTLSRVNGNDIGIVRDEGLFANAPNVLYQYEKHLNQENLYKIKVTNTGTGHVASAETEIIHEFEFDVLLNPTNVAPFQALNFASSTPRLIQFRLPTNASLYNFNIDLNYRESNIDDPSIFEDKEITMTIANELEIPFNDQRSLARATITQDDFYNWISGQIQLNENVMRCPGFIDFNFAFADSIFYKYILINNANQGLTSFQASNVFTNIEGGFGLFASRHIRKVKLGDIYEFAEQDGFELSEPSLDSLVMGLETQHLNFIDSRPCLD